jgi:hypothetical protein
LTPTNMAKLVPEEALISYVIESGRLGHAKGEPQASPVAWVRNSPEALFPQFAVFRDN